MQAAEYVAAVHVHVCYGDYGGYDNGLAQGAAVAATVSTTWRKMKILIPIRGRAQFQNILLYHSHGSKIHFLNTTPKE